MKRIAKIIPVDVVRDWKDEYKRTNYMVEMWKQRKQCKRSIVLGIRKLRDWCDFLDDYKPPAIWPPASTTTTTSSYLMASTPATRGIVNMTRVDIPNETNEFLHRTIGPSAHNETRTILGGSPGISAGYGFAGRNGCYDDFNCDTPDLSHLNHYLMGIFALTICVIGVLANTLCVPSFNIHANRSSATFYMTAIAVCDTLVLILCTLVYVMKNVPADYVSQETVYKTFSGYLIPSAMPALELCELMSFWIVIALLIDRFFYLRNGFQSKAVCSRSLCAKVILTIFGCLVLYTAPKYLQYKIVEFEIKTPVGPSVSSSGNMIESPSKQKTKFEIRHEVKVMLTQISRSDGYRNVMTHWLKVPVEMFIPMLLLTGLTGYFLFKVVENRGAWYGQIKRSRHTPPAISNPLRTIVTERQVRQENVNILIALGVGLLVIACKMPKFVAHVLVSETERISPAFQIAVRFLDVLCAALKPALYLGVGDHLHRGIFGMFWSSCRAHEETAANEIARHMELNNVNNINMSTVIAAAATHAATGNGSPGATSPEECLPLNPNGDTGAEPVERSEENVVAEQPAVGSDVAVAISVATPSGDQEENKDNNMVTAC